MARLAIISDIHGNLHALQAVFDRLASTSFDELICLGDVVGYGPHPMQCLDLVMKHCSVVITGNHEDAVLDPEIALEFNGAARQAIDWTRNVLRPLHFNALSRMRPMAMITTTDVLCVHDSPVPGPMDYVHDSAIAAIAFTGFDGPLCLLGHTHVPMAFETAAGAGERVTARQVSAHLPVDGRPVQLEPDRRYILNPGSVGQPRDADPRASFALLDTEAMTFTVHREAYDVAGAQAATQEAGLPMVLADRLAIGA